MQLLTLAALAATATASFAVRDDQKPKTDYGVSRVINRCPYDVYLWSVDKQLGCGKESSKLLKKNGGQWEEQMQDGTDGGISIKLSKWDDCGGKELSQLEYKIDNSTVGFTGNYLDMSFVDCQVKGDCPGWHDGFYLQSGKTGKTNQIYKASENNEHCPILKAANAAEAAKISYVLPDDRQTKYCNENADLVLYLCGDQAPDASAPSSAAPSSAAPSSSKAASSSSYKALPTTLQVTPSKPASSAEDVQVKAAAVTPAPQAPEPEAPKAVKTVVTYVTAYVDAPVRKRHAHGRRHNRA